MHACMQQCVALCLFPYEDTIHECSPPCINIYMYVMVTCDELILCKDFHRFSNCFTAWCHFALQVIFIHYTVLFSARLNMQCMFLSFLCISDAN